ncbi:Bug family tripartite tricarboxylate transporter substrate binding protein [Variovorax sp. RA8]|uniref:Bug family tripartite tricarboxylate transporter substrate binding protein n=1 Tax=Variovorax sp. (strain JCM 16519 / RA8) TaxID=662548 RepID=UPI0013161D85|nr:tripartite tricarboxylate transporter substrate binding protein [Variovorax sp. RA8]VTU13672.1 Argininosuccinate lyase [Variovorax sp. RA8]
MRLFQHRVGRAIAPAVVAIVACVGGAALADAYPSKPIKMVVPFPPGGGFDAIARPFAEKLGGALGQAVVVENRAGAGGNIGAESVVRSAADGYTLLFGNDNLATNPNVYRNIKYDPLKDFVPLGMVATIPIAIAVNPNVKAATLPELLALSRTTPLNYGTPGIGTSPHLLAEMVSFSNKAKFVHIPYRGTGLAITDAIGGQIDMVVAPASAVAPHIRSGKLRGVVVLSAERSPLLPNLPAVPETGLTGMEYDIWYALFAPAGTPEPVVRKLRDASRAAIAQPGFAENLRELGIQVKPGQTTDITELLKTDLARWKAVVDRTSIVAD